MYNTTRQKLLEGKQVFSFTQSKFDIKAYCEAAKHYDYAWFETRAESQRQDSQRELLHPGSGPQHQHERRASERDNMQGIMRHSYGAERNLNARRQQGSGRQSQHPQNGQPNQAAGGAGAVRRLAGAWHPVRRFRRERVPPP